MTCKAISYISSIRTNLTSKDLEDLIVFAENSNNKNNVTGIFIVMDKNFYQVIEGEPHTIDVLFKKIQNDKRHNGLVKLFDQEIDAKIFESYIGGDFAVIKSRADLRKLKQYLNWIKKADIPEINELLLLTENFLKHNHQ